MRAPKILLVKPPLDGHDRPINDLIVSLRKHNIDPVWPGLQQSWMQIVKTAVEEDPDVIGISLHTGDPIVLLGHLKHKLDEAGLGRKILVAGGSGEIIFPDVRETLCHLGFKVFLSATPKKEIAKYILEKFRNQNSSRQKLLAVPEGKISRQILASLITQAETRKPISLPVCPNRAFRVLFSGPTGAGKSSLLNAILERFGKYGMKIAVFLCDPRGPKLKGAFLGDRLVVQDHTSNENIFIRSISQFGSYNKKSASLLAKAASLAEFWGARVIFFETIGMGQDLPVTIKDLADMLVWVSLPNETDEIRLMKGGPHELADVILLNKIDKEPAFRAELALKEYFAKPYFAASALTGQGIDSFCEFLEEQRKTKSP